jgi:hypothetical protein
MYVHDSVALPCFDSEILLLQSTRNKGALASTATDEVMVTVTVTIWVSGPLVPVTLTR